MIPVAEARARIAAALVPVGRETVALAQACGRVLAEPVIARRTQPPLALSSMDGWALRAADVTVAPTTLAVIGESAAGRGFEGRLGPGQAVRIFTGAPLPDGADAIVIQEDSSRNGDRVTLTEVAMAGRFIRPAGQDFREGSVLVGAGRRLGARDIGLVAAGDLCEVEVHRRPRIALLASGDELTPPGQARGPAQIVDAARPALTAFLAARGAEVIDLGIARDEAADITAKASGARDADLLVTIGGASVGDHDLTARVLASEGADLDFWKVAMRPGKPLMFGRHGDVPLLGLPGNPVSALVCAILFLGPAVARLCGLPLSAPPFVEVRLTAPLAANDRREDYIRASLSPG
ncbi:MAG: molybdopterin molybdotransferase MoeA, partial [Zavarzinia sp.]|nr:molybdopterin molybdotransferase MoeA [Zavarzinia sp.]